MDTGQTNQENDMIEYVLIMAAIAIGLAIAAWRSMRDLWTVLPDEDEHAEPFVVKAPGLPHNRRGR
jgi:heme/copper-type cytochrome/quinol oxidase subunit 2